MAKFWEQKSEKLLSSIIWIAFGIYGRVTVGWSHRAQFTFTNAHFFWVQMHVIKRPYFHVLELFHWYCFPKSEQKMMEIELVGSWSVPYGWHYFFSFSPIDWHKRHLNRNFLRKLIMRNQIYGESCQTIEFTSHWSILLEFLWEFENSS